MGKRYMKFILLGSLLGLTACQNQWFVGWVAGAGSARLAIPGGLVDLNWTRGDGKLTVKGKAEFAPNNLYIQRRQNQIIIDQKEVQLGEDGRFETTFDDQPLADHLCIEYRCIEL